MMKANSKKIDPAGDDLLAQVLGLKNGNGSKPQKSSEAQQDKMQAALAKLAEQNPALVAEIIQKWLTEENKPAGKPDRFSEYPPD